MEQRPDIRYAPSLRTGLALPKFRPGIGAGKLPVLLLLTLLAVKFALLAIDPQVRFFFGDSASYLWSAESGWIPPDRSFTYPYLIRVTAVATHWLPALAIAQSLCGVLVALVLFYLLTTTFSLARPIAFVVTVLFSVGPEQLFYERMMMAEAIGSMMFVLCLLCGFLYLRRRNWIWLCLGPLCGIAAVSLRMNLLPVVLGFSVLPIFAAWSDPQGAAGRMSWRQLAVHTLIAMLATSLLHTGYKQWRAYEHGGMKPHDYIAYGGYFKLGLVTPLVKPEHLRGLGLPDDLLSRDIFALDDPHTRESQLWQANGLIDLIRKSVGDGKGNRTAGKIAERALRSDPLGLVRLAYLTTWDYFNRAEVEHRMADDLGNRMPDAELEAKLRQNYGFEYPAPEAWPSPTRNWFGTSAPWLIACMLLLAPLGLATILAGWRHMRRPSALLGVASLGVVAGHVLFSHIISFRYLHAFPFFVLLNIGALAALWMRQVEPAPQLDLPLTG